MKYIVTFQEICGVGTSPPDGLEWTVGKAAPIREDNLYGGVRIKLTAYLGNIRIPGSDSPSATIICTSSKRRGHEEAEPSS